jgi:hypothetical protein
MAPRYPVLTQNSNKALNELKKLEGFGSELENLIGAGSAADGISAADVANYLKELGSKTSLHDTNIVNINSDLATRALKTTLKDTARALKTTLKDTDTDLQQAKTKIPSQIDPVIFTPSWSGSNSYDLPEIVNGMFPLLGLDYRHTDSLVLPHTNGISADWQSEFTNAVIDVNFVTNLAASLVYKGSGTVAEESLVNTKVYTVDDGFNFSCKVTLADENGNGQVLGHNASVEASGIVGMSTINAYGASEMEIVLVKDQGSSVIRVWKNSTEITDATFTFSPGRLVVIANSNATFSEVKLTDTTVDLGVSSMLKEYIHVRIATIQAANPITQQNVDNYAKINVIVKNEPIRFDSTKDYSSVGYVLKVGAAQYYQVGTYDSILLEAELAKRLGNAIVGADLALGGDGTGATYIAANTNLENPKAKSVTLSIKYYSNDVASLREQLTSTGTGSPTFGFGDLTAITQGIVLAGYKQSLVALGSPVPADNVIIATLTQAFSGYSLLQVVLAVAFGGRPSQTAVEFINSADAAVVTQTNPSGDFTVQNIESYKQISNKLADFDFALTKDSMTVTNNASFATTDSLKVAMLTDIGTQGAYILAGMIPEQLTINSWTLNTLDPAALDTVINDSASFPDSATFGAFGLSAVSDKFIAVLNTFSGIGPSGGQAYFDGLSYKTFAQTFLLQTAATGKDMAIVNLNGDHTLDVASLATGDEQKFRQALAMKEKADVVAALTIPANVVSGYSVLGLLPPGTHASVLWYFVSPTRSPDNVWSYTRSYDLATMSYVDADVRREGDVTIITDLTTVPQPVKDKYSSEHAITLDEAGVVNAVDKILWNYTGEGGQLYYNYTDVSNPLDKINKVAVSFDGSNWLTDSQAFEATWIAAVGFAPTGKVNSVSVDSWAGVQDRLVVLATP